ncbi:MAG: protein kinase [Burkholderiales bacterium]|nr:protein kinase [Burkholderiales bacterium]
MDRTRWQQLSDLLDEALALPPAGRPAWLATLAERDAELGAQVQRMLKQADAEMTEPVGPEFGQWLGQALNQPQTISFTAPAVAGQRCGAWELLHKIGEGGMGQVWLARRADGLYEAQAAIKLLRSDVPATSLAARFARERAVLARLNHPAIARLLDAGIEGGRAFLVLEHVDGHSLAEHVRDHCPTVAERVRLMIRIAEGVEHAHAQLIVHRDLKPSNVLVTAAGDPKLLDFGIAGVLDAEGQAGDAQLTRQLGRLMTPAYAAPEQVKGDPIGTAADVFSLSVMLFELLSGELPFAPRGSERTALEHALLHKEARRLTQTRPGRMRARPAARTAGAGPAPSTLPPDPAEAATPLPPPSDFRRVRGDLEAVVAKGLRKQPAERYGSVRALILDLERWLSHRPVSVRRDDWRHQAGLWLRRNALVAATAGGVAIALLAGLAATSWQWRRAEAAAHQSDQVTQYLSELLASASPDRHGGQPPTVMALLEASRAELGQRFADDPDTLLRLQQVLIDTYHALNRFDIAIPLAEQRLALARREQGPDAEETRAAQVSLARAYLAVQAPARVVALLAERVAAHDRRDSAELRSNLLFMLGVSQAQLGRTDESQRTLDEAWVLVRQQHRPEDFETIFFANYLAILRLAQGRLGEAESLLAATQPHWDKAPKHYLRFVLVLRRGLLAARQRLGRYEGLDAQAQALQTDMDALLGRGNDMAVALVNERARWLIEQGQATRALALQSEAEQRLQAVGVTHGFVRVPMAAQRLLAQVLAGRIERAAALQQVRETLEAIEREPVLGGQRRSDAWLALAQVALAESEPWLAAQVLERVRTDAEASLATNQALAGRLAVLDSALLRLQGNAAASRERLQQRLAQVDGWSEPRVMPAWQVRLELACTQWRLGDLAAAAATLKAADARRPAQLPAGHPYDAARQALGLRLAASGADTEAWRQAWQAVEQAWQRPPGRVQAAGCGLL